jgi:hypothetical protein
VKSARAQRQPRRNAIRRRRLIESTGGPALSQRDVPARLVELQRTHGNAYVSRLIQTNRVREATGQSVQRDPAAPLSLNPRAAGGGSGVAAEEADPSAAMGDGWKPIYKLISEQLGEAKLKEYAKTLASKGVDLLISQAKDGKDTSFLDKAQLDLLGTMLADHAKTVAEGWVASPEGKIFRERLLTITKDAPGVVVAAALAGAAIAYLANPDLPELNKKFDLFKGLSAEGTVDIGKIQSMTVQKAAGALKFTSSHFKAGLSGEYVGEGDKKGTTLGASAAISDKEISFKTAMKLNPDGSVKIDLGPAIDMKKFGMETGVSITGSDMSAIVGIRIGDKDTFVSAKTKVDPDGKVSLDLGLKAGGIEAEGKVKGIGTDKTSGEASLTGTNIFGVKGLDAKGTLKFSPGTVNAGGSISYSADTKQGKAFISFSGETLHGDPKKEGPAIGAQGVIGVGFRFK